MAGVGRGRGWQNQDLRDGGIFRMGLASGFVLSADHRLGYSYEKSRRQYLASGLTALIDWVRIVPSKEREFLLS